MKAFVYERYGAPAEVMEQRELEREAPGENRVEVRVRAASVNAYDWHLIRADPFLVRVGGVGLFRPKLPRTGADFAGEVVAVGPGVEGFSVGDAVFGSAAPTGGGAFAEYVTVSPKFLTRIPEGISFGEAAAVPMAALTALQALRDTGKLQKGQSVAVNGASGGVGTYAVQLAVAMGAEVTAVCSAGKVDRARALGAHHVIDYRETDFTTTGTQYDLILGVNGYQHLKDYIRALKPQGTYVMVGGTNKQIMQGMMRTALMNRRVSQTLATAMEKPNAADLEYVASLMKAGSVTSVIDRKFAFEQTPEAVSYVEDGHAAGKVVITAA